MNLQDTYIILGIIGGGGLAGLARALWRMASAAQRLIGAIDQNTEVTAGLARDMAALRKATRRRDRELASRITTLEQGAHRGQTQPAADPRPPHRRARRPGPDRRRRMGPL